MDTNLKREKLEKLDTLVLDKMIDYIESGKVDMVKELTTAVQYLKANQVVEPPKSKGDDPVEESKRRLEEAKRRRKEREGE